MGKVIPLLLLVVLFNVVAVSAEVGKVNTELIIRKTVTVGDLPISSLDVNITVLDPNNVALIKFEPMTFDSDSQDYYFTLAGGNLTTLGEYAYKITATNGDLNKTSEYKFEITPTGKLYTTSEGLTYILLITFLVFLFILSLYGAIKISSKNHKNEFGETIEINWGKYSKYLLGGLSYMLFVWIIYFAWNISYGFLQLGAMTTAFYWLYRLCFAISFPVIIFILLAIILNYTSDKKMQGYYDQGVSALTQ